LLVNRQESQRPRTVAEIRSIYLDFLLNSNSLEIHQQSSGHNQRLYLGAASKSRLPGSSGTISSRSPW
jgi:hypothetical protein